MSNTLTPAAVNALFEKNAFIEAYAAALALFAQQPGDYETGLIFLRTAIFIERVDGVIALLHDLSARVPPQSLHLLLFQAYLCDGQFKAAWQHLQQTGLPTNSMAFHDCAYRIHFQQYNLSAALEQLNAKERLGDCTLDHFLKKLEIFKLQGQFADSRQQLAMLQSSVPQSETKTRAQLQLWHAGIAHDEHDFALGLRITGQLIEDFLALPQVEQRVNVAMKTKPWTRQRQHQVIKDLEHLILLHALPMFMVAGSVLSLVREGDFFINDKDLDLGLLDADFEHATQLLIDSPHFDDISPANYFVGYKQLRHRATGLIVDVTHYQTNNEEVHAIWRHVSGEILRKTVFAKFALREAFFPSLRCRVLIPDQVETYLETLYGDWRTPDKNFDTVIAARNLSELTPFLLSLGFIKIADALHNDHYKKARSTVEHLQDNGYQHRLLTKIHELF